MPSPFPGMDPYLEDPDIFPNLHHDLITFIEFALQERLPPSYFAAVGTRDRIEMNGKMMKPDLDVFQPQLADDEHHEGYVDIISGRDEKEKVVTSVEVLSPSNKSTSGAGLEQYLRKQDSVVETGTNLVEIDLLRAGQHTTLVPLNLLRARGGLFDYHVCVRRFNRRGEFRVSPIRLAQSLRKITVPLLPEDPPVVIDLQAVFNRAYDNGPYRRRIHYGRDRIVPPLTPEQAAWANDLVRQKGLLTS